MALTADVATKVSADGEQAASTSFKLLEILILFLTIAAKNFVDHYYPSLNTSRGSLSSFYMPPATMPDGKPLPVIVYNGNIIPDPASMQKLFQERIPQAHYEVQDYDCQVLNPHYVAEGTQGATATSGKNMTILITVSGYVRYGEPRAATMRGFSENFVLIPNPVVEKAKGRHTKEWLVQSQNFRLVV